MIRGQLRLLNGMMQKMRSRITNQPVVLQDWTGNQYWQYPNDKIVSNFKRNAISDAINVTRFLQKHVSGGDVCIDMGANIGGVSVPFWTKVGLNGLVVSVEADPANISRIKANLRLNGYPDDFVINKAVANSNETMLLHCFPPIYNGWQTLGGPTDLTKDIDCKVIEIETITYADVVNEYDLEHVDFVKIDVEGAELMVLEGMSPYLANKDVSSVIFEVNQYTLDGFGIQSQDVINHWKTYDYTLWRIETDGGLVPYSSQFLSNRVWDCVAIASKRQDYHSYDQQHV